MSFDWNLCLIVQSNDCSSSELMENINGVQQAGNDNMQSKLSSGLQKIAKQHITVWSSLMSDQFWSSFSELLTDIYF